MPTHSAPADEPNASLAPLVIVGVLPPIEGGEDNLLPKDAWLNPLRVEFELWSDHSTLPGVFDRVQLIWDGDEAHPVHEKQFDGPYTEEDLADLWLEVPASRLSEGGHTIFYKVWSWNQSPIPRVSDPVNVTIDKSPPVLAGDRKLVFPPAIVPPNEITARYLNDPANSDQVLATLPDYAVKKVGDVIRWYWEEFPNSQHLVDSLTLAPGNVGQPLRLPLKGDMLRERGNGPRYATCRVRDRAGHEVTTVHVPLDVNILPPPLRRPPSVKEAPGTVLDPQFYGVTGVTVVIPRQDDEGEGYKREVFWRGYGDMGFHHAPEPRPSNPSEFAIPAAAIPSSIGTGRVVEITYRVEGDAKESEPLKLRVSTIPSSKFPLVDCPQAARGNPLKLSRSAVGSEGAGLTLAAWVYQAPTQYINIWLTSASLPDEPVRVAWPVSQGINRATLPKTYLNRLPLNAIFAVRVSVSFDGGDSYLPFLSRDIQVLA